MLLIVHEDDFAALDGHPATVHTKIIGNFAIILHFEDGEIGLFAGFEGTDVFLTAKSICGVDGRGGDGFGGSHAKLCAGKRENHGHADGGTGAGIVVGGECDDSAGVD